MDLRIQAEQLARFLPEARVHARASTAAKLSAVRRERWLIAVSGGSDSVALLMFLWAHFPEQRQAMFAVHFNHRLRGKESDEDEVYCREICERLDLALRVGHWADAPAQSTEEEARQARYSFFKHVADEENASALFTGHQKDDIAETQLMRLARGASAGGMAAPRPVRKWSGKRIIVRPFLSLSRAEIQNALREAEIVWREDSSNVGDRYYRNRVRSDVVPPWIQVSSVDALQGAALTREWMEEDDDALEFILDEWGVSRETEELDLRKLAGKPRGLWRRALRRWTPGRELSWTAFDHLLTLCLSEGGRCSVGTGMAVVRNGRLRWVPGAAADETGGWTAAHSSEDVALLLPDGSELRWKRVPVDTELRDRLRGKRVDVTRAAFVELKDTELVVRPWIQGDRYRSLGSPGSTKLQDLFVNRKISVGRKSQLPVVCRADGRIVWVPGLPPAEDAKVNEHSVTAVQLTYVPGTSTVKR